VQTAQCIRAFVRTSGKPSKNGKGPRHTGGVEFCDAAMPGLTREKIRDENL
jgi:hypothetical protein